MKFLLMIFVVLLLHFCKKTDSNDKHDESGKTENFSPKTTIVTDTINKTSLQTNQNLLEKDTNTITYKIIELPNKTFGYEIIKNGKTIILQKRLPGISGNLGTTSFEKAERIAKLVIHKLQNKIIPPTISKRELDSLFIFDKQ